MIQIQVFFSILFLICPAHLNLNVVSVYPKLNLQKISRSPDPRKQVKEKPTLIQKQIKLIIIRGCFEMSGTLTSQFPTELYQNVPRANLIFIFHH